MLQSMGHKELETTWPLKNSNSNSCDKEVESYEAKEFY